MSWYEKDLKQLRFKDKDDFNGLSLDQRIKEMIKDEQIEESCTSCGGGLIKLKQIGKVICPSCAKQELEEEKKDLENTWSKNAIKAMSWAYFNDYSILKNKTIKQAGLKNFITTEEQAKKAKDIAKKYIGAILEKKTPHMILSGKPGRGKTHIAMATARSVIEMSPEEIKVLFIHYSAFLKFKQTSFSEKDKKLRVSEIETEMMNCDLLVVDDLGVELGSLRNPKEPSSWNIDTLTLIMEAREDKPLIVTTNFDEPQIIESYEDRNQSRMFKHSNGFRIEFSNITDKRMDF
ncbi:hypothetical protein BKP56_09125 [Marinilactibacillus sp. 15R]|uniref:DnaA ATPase domain-containing protein n=1 Tax=Marinilactibacillus sp. 15R TaxID=1911586 RepID=UPI00090B60A6|nr:DnaA/Hda family protein [Marinilactibacillus sp. 15R]API89405.1 hypothetical protein BKP56_09125 [Marinilactibacillus sp. 15R]